MIRYLFISIFLVVFFSACASIDRDEIRKEAKLPSVGDSVSASGLDRQIEGLLENSSGTVGFPKVVGVYLFSPKNSTAHWTARDRGKIVSWVEKEELKPLIEHMFPISGLSATGSSLEEIRLVAAKHGADLLLAIKSEGELDTGLNPLSLFYLTGVGYLFVPGSQAEAYIASDAVLLDVASGESLAGMEARGEGSTWAPGAWLDTSNALRESKAEVLNELSRQFSIAMQSYAETEKASKKAIKEAVERNKFESEQKVEIEKAPEGVPFAIEKHTSSRSKISTRRRAVSGQDVVRRRFRVETPITQTQKTPMFRIIGEPDSQEAKE